MMGGRCASVNISFSSSDDHDDDEIEFQYSIQSYYKIADQDFLDLLKFY